MKTSLFLAHARQMITLSQMIKNIHSQALVIEIFFTIFNSQSMSEINLNETNEKHMFINIKKKNSRKFQMNK